jgi:hypothetical protein
MYADRNPPATGKTPISSETTKKGVFTHVVAYDATGVTVLTWGNTQKATWAWWDECADEAYAILPLNAQQAGFPPGFDLAQLQADLKLVAG